MKCGTFSGQKTGFGYGKPVAAILASLISQECGKRDNAAFMLLHERLKRWNAAVFFADGWNAYGDIIPAGLLVQTKSETRLTESNNAPSDTGLRDLDGEPVPCHAHC